MSDFTKEQIDKIIRDLRDIAKYSNIPVPINLAADCIATLERQASLHNDQCATFEAKIVELEREKASTDAENTSLKNYIDDLKDGRASLEPREPLRSALRAIKDLVVGERSPNWSLEKEPGDSATYRTRGRIADICDSALGLTTWCWFCRKDHEGACIDTRQPLETHCAHELKHRYIRDDESCGIWCMTCGKDIGNGSWLQSAQNTGEDR